MLPINPTPTQNIPNTNFTEVVTEPERGLEIKRLGKAPESSAGTGTPWGISRACNNLKEGKKSIIEKTDDGIKHKKMTGELAKPFSLSSAKSTEPFSACLSGIKDDDDIKYEKMTEDNDSSAEDLFHTQQSSITARADDEMGKDEKAQAGNDRSRHVSDDLDSGDKCAMYVLVICETLFILGFGYLILDLLLNGPKFAPSEIPDQTTENPSE